MRSRFDFSSATRGRFSDRYEQNHSVTLLDGDPDMEDPLDISHGDSQLTEVFGKNLLISHLVSAGFSLDLKYKRFPHLLIAYVWNVQGPEPSDIYALTFGDALQVMEKRGHAKTDSWTKKGYYFVRDAGGELKKLLEPYRMTPERWREKLQTV
jgi:hypothetical protein